MIKTRVKKKKKCRYCKQEFVPMMTTQVVCGNRCAIAYAKKQEKKVFDKQTRDMKQAMKTRNELLDEAQMAFNAYIRERDNAEPCISCGTVNPQIQYAAGHYKTSKAQPSIRFHEWNVHRQCNHHCNKQLSGNINNYRKALIKKLGIDVVLWLEKDHPLQKWTEQDAIEIKEYYRDKLKWLRSTRQHSFDKWVDGLGD